MTKETLERLLYDAILLLEGQSNMDLYTILEELDMEEDDYQNLVSSIHGYNDAFNEEDPFDDEDDDFEDDDESEEDEDEFDDDFLDEDWNADKDYF